MRQGGFSLAEGAFEETALLSMRWAEKVVKGLNNLDCDGKREIVRTVVRRIEIDQNNVEVIFRVPPNGGLRPRRRRSPEPGGWWRWRARTQTDAIHWSPMDDRS